MPTYAPALRNFIDARDYGAVPDSFYTDGNAANASTSFSSAGNDFLATDPTSNIVVLRAGAGGSFNEYHTTIAGYTDQQHVTLTNALNRTQNPARFYVSRAGDQTTKIQAAIDAAAAAGGGVVVLPGVGYLVSGLVLKNRVVLKGAGERATFLHAAAGSNKPVIANDTTLDNSAMFCGVESLSVSGNYQRQTDLTATLTAQYTAGDANVQLVSSAGLPPSGVVELRAATKSITNAANNGSGLVRITSAGHGYLTGQLITVANVVGTTEANGTWFITFVDANNYDLQASTFANAYVSGGTGQLLVRCAYTNISGNNLVLLSGGKWEGGADGTVAVAGSTVTCINASGINFTVNPYSTSPANAEDYDPHFWVRDVMITNCRGYGVEEWGQSETRLDNVYVYNCRNVGVHVSYDSWVSNCTAAQCGRAGFHMFGGQNMVTNCKAFGNGNAGVGGNKVEGWGFIVESSSSPAPGQYMLSSCLAQDNNADGYLAKFTDRMGMASCGADSNGQQKAGIYVGCRMVGVNNCTIDLVCTERNAGLNYQQSGINIDAASTNNTIRLTHSAGKAGVTISTAIQAGSSVDKSNIISVNGISAENLPILHPGFMATVGLPLIGASAVTTAISGTSYFQYLGRVAQPITTIDVVVRVTTLVSTITWAEVGIFKGTPVANGTVTLTRLGFVDVSATFNSTGIKKTTIALSGVSPGDDLWFAYGSQATQPFQLRGTVADDIQSGVLQEKASTRISTVAAATAMGVSANTLVGAAVTAKL